MKAIIIIGIVAAFVLFTRYHLNKAMKVDENDDFDDPFTFQ